MSGEILFVGAGVRLRAREWTRGLCAGKRVALACEPNVWRRYGKDFESGLKKAAPVGPLPLRRS